MVTHEYIAATCYSVYMDREVYKKAEGMADETRLVFYDENTKEEIPIETVLEHVCATKIIPKIKGTGCEATDDLFVSAMMLQLHGYKEQARKTIKHGLYLLLQHHMAPSKLEKIENVIKSTKQQAIAKKPRNKHYSEAMRIAAATWERYPAASKGQLCKNLQNHFNGEVSVDRLEIWIKDAGIQPVKPAKHTSFVLVT